MTTKINARPKNFGEILTAAKELLRYMAESDEKSWHEKYEAMWYEKLNEVAELVFANAYLAEYLSFRDIQDRFFYIASSARKSVKEITHADLESFLDNLLTSPETYQFYFPAIDLFGFPENYAIGVCVLHSYPQLPADAKAYISSTWESDYDDDEERFRLYANFGFEPAQV